MVVAVLVAMLVLVAVLVETSAVSSTAVSCTLYFIRDELKASFKLKETLPLSSRLRSEKEWEAILPLGRYK